MKIAAPIKPTTSPTGSMIIVTPSPSPTIIIAKPTTTAAACPSTLSVVLTHGRCHHASMLAMAHLHRPHGATRVPRTDPTFALQSLAVEQRPRPTHVGKFPRSHEKIRASARRAVSVLAPAADTSMLEGRWPPSGEGTRLAAPVCRADAIRPASA